MATRKLVSGRGLCLKRKRIICGEEGMPTSASDFKTDDIPSDSRSAMDYFRSLFSKEKFNFKVPPIILKHQLYSLVTNRTLVDKELGSMQESNDIVLLRLHTLANEIAVVFTKDLIAHLKSVLSASALEEPAVGTFVSDVIPSIRDVALDRCDLETYKLDDDSVTTLMDHGLLIARNHRSWFLSLPNVALFTQSLSKGRAVLLRMIRLCKFHEMLLVELEKRDISRHSKLGITYHIHDIMGAELVNRVESTSGTILRITDEKVKKKKKSNLQSQPF